jgi:DNA ligase-1
MKAFARLYTALDETNKTNEKIDALTRYFAEAPAADAAWAVYFLSGRKPRQVVPTRKLCAWAMELADVPEWLFNECYESVGDLGETIALLLPAPEASNDIPLHRWVEERLLPLRGADEVAQRESVIAAWLQMDSPQRYVWNKLITGSFRVGVSQGLVTRALALVKGVDANVVAHRLMGNWEPTPAFYAALVALDTQDAHASQPYPFFLAFPLEDKPDSLGEVADWQAEWKWDGIRAQLVRRQGQTFLWSRGEELVTERYPEIREAGDRLPEGTVIDGEIMPWKNGAALPFAQLQRRIGRKDVGKKVLEEVPVVLVTYDLLELEGQDLRNEPLRRRRELLEQIIADTPAEGRFVLSPVVQGASWEDLAHVREECRDRRVEGLMLKRLNSPYRVGRQRGDWWKWKVEPYTVDAVLVYAQLGHGRRASLYTDYTFAVWDEGKLVPFAKAYSGLKDAEIRAVDAFVRDNTVERFGPVRMVKPELVFELAFEAIQRSSRHKSGIAVRFPRMVRQRIDKTVEEADSLETIRAMLPADEAVERRT